MATLRFSSVSSGRIDLAHATRADLGSDVIGAEARARRQRQRLWRKAVIIRGG